jgi:hypothetical protein
MHGWQPGLKAVSMAKQNYAVILAKSTFSEESRQWADPISPLQCAAWAGNTHLVKEFLDILPKELKKEALDQLTVVRDHGLEHPNLSGMLALKKNSTAFDGTVIQETFRQPAQVVMQFFHTEFPDFPEPLTLSSINRITHRTTHKFLPKYALQLELSTYDMLFDAVIDQFCELRQQVLMQQVKDLETEVEQYIKSQVDAHKVRQHRLSS